MKAKTRHWFIYQQPCFRFHIFAIHLIGVRIMPLAGRDVKAIVIPLRTEDISIHAPLAGRDLDAIAGNRMADMQFQSTRPLRGATAVGAVIAAADIISIHAPLAGRDLWNRA